MIHSVFELGDTIVREVMVPRTDVVFIERDKTLRQALSLALRSGFSRIPVIGDGTDDVVGVAYLKDMVRRTYVHRDGESVERVESVMRPAVFVPESKPVDELLREMQAQQTHVAIVVDEYGGTAGLVTIEDVLEEIVGEITDEYDVETPLSRSCRTASLRVSTRLHVDELAERLDVELEDDDVDTVGGLLAKHLGRVPIPGAQVVGRTASSSRPRARTAGATGSARCSSAGSATASRRSACRAAEADRMSATPERRPALADRGREAADPGAVRPGPRRGRRGGGGPRRHGPHLRRGLGRPALAAAERRCRRRSPRPSPAARDRLEAACRGERLRRPGRWRPRGARRSRGRHRAARRRRRHVA